MSREGEEHHGRQHRSQEDREEAAAKNWFWKNWKMLALAGAFLSGGPQGLQTMLAYAGVGTAPVAQAVSEEKIRQAAEKAVEAKLGPIQQKQEALAEKLAAQGQDLAYIKGRLSAAGLRAVKEIAQNTAAAAPVP